MTNNINALAISSESGFYSYLQKINKIPSLTQEEEFLLAKSYLEENDLQAAHKLVTSHLKLVAKIASSYKTYGLPITELVSEGNIGLMQAVKKFNPELGFRLSTYAMWWIKASIQEYILKSWSLVKMGTTAAQKKLFFSLNKVKHKITNLYSRAITTDDFAQIADELGVSVNEVSEMNTRISGPDLSLNNSINSDDVESGELIELLPELRPTPEAMAINKQNYTSKRKLLSNAMQILNDRELRILKDRKLTDTPKTLDILSSEYNISKERIRQIENTAFEKIKKFILNNNREIA
ncbi:RNA polymerase sigma factor RpoH [Rickettsia prowazekii]|uniref:RNA polymerase sigma factor RpoH n=2 Tax=Rickettsia prowazekii TaxID=782 RepID=Q9ZDM4_RICPR|nr:RNA polymerase sigma factor RpoH [Rickettsia prowazekii]EOB09659.1 Protein TolB [Rickettsia prowazekii str. GvF12]ADE29818.1 RNA polymerase sigma-32 factor [Rickettsia prowazekii str. Rp22]AFE49120.1 RNA polymerase factor sigma-32 [Rickettsia prowazekii str. Chernikova]AFE49966.1 RNA polymerase factor sigma-32 [Rickettsia prowazekii str. Katsinyian]AFE50810.1 RNA polymerase factor sigma-32 [Rickettsia prowazekii str. BuV67-CWPP]